VFTGPSGVGKGTLLRSVLERHPDLRVSVSATTRSPRPGEADGQHYHFVSREHFREMIEHNMLLEWAEFAGNYYGTPREPVEACILNGEQVVLEIELQGARQVIKRFPQAFTIFIKPPSLEELEHRIRGRAQDSEAAILQRLERAKDEISAADEFDVQIVNDDLAKALKQLEALLFPTLAYT
jgi:guanylate kinase